MTRSPLSFMRGLSLVELMIGMSLGLFIVAGALAIHAQHLRTGSDLTLQAQLHQEMRAAMDLVTRDVRRARYWEDALKGTVANADGSPPPTNPFRVLSVSSADGPTVSYQYQPPEVDAETAFRIRLTDTVLRMRIGDGVFQPLTDASLIAVTQFQITPNRAFVPLPDACMKPCSVAAGTCPLMEITVLDITLTAQIKHKPEITRTLTTRVRPRNDALEGTCPA